MEPAPMADNFNLDILIKSIKDLRNMELARQLREALRTQDLSGMDTGLISELVEELENDLEEHISRLERICAVLTADERLRPESMNHARQQEVAWQSKCDLDEVQGVCEAFARARELLGTMGAAERQNLDLRVLLTNLGGVMGLEAVKETPQGLQFTPEFLQKLMQKGLAANKPAASARKQTSRELDEFEALFDLDKPVQPKNRLPKDFRAK
jgi:Signal peptide binding domain